MARVAANPGSVVLHSQPWCDPSRHQGMLLFRLRFVTRRSDTCFPRSPRTSFWMRKVSDCGAMWCKFAFLTHILMNRVQGTSSWVTLVLRKISWRRRTGLGMAPHTRRRYWIRQLSLLWPQWMPMMRRASHEARAASMWYRNCYVEGVAYSCSVDRVTMGDNVFPCLVVSLWCDFHVNPFCSLPSLLLRR